MGTSTGAAKRQRCACGQFMHPGKPCGKPGPAARRTAEEKAETARSYQRKWRSENPEQSKILHKRWRDGVKLRVLQAYGGEDPACACCGISQLVFLTIDHVNDDGAASRRKTGTKGGTVYYAHLLREGCPPGYQVLCWNCNSAKHLLGICPHQL